MSVKYYYRLMRDGMDCLLKVLTEKIGLTNVVHMQ